MRSLKHLRQFPVILNQGRGSALGPPAPLVGFAPQSPVAQAPQPQYRTARGSQGGEDVLRGGLIPVQVRPLHLRRVRGMQYQVVAISRQLIVRAACLQQQLDRRDRVKAMAEVNEERRINGEPGLFSSRLASPLQ